jgi:pimeloyl-ACP methyl ester carboxylesterase
MAKLFRLRNAVFAGLIALPLACSADARKAEAPRPESRDEPSSVRIVRKRVPGDLPVLTLDPARGRERVVFLHGLCSEPEKYLRSFRFAAARFGRTIALHGDVQCPGKSKSRRTWSQDPRVLDRRIEAAWRALGHGSPLEDVVVVGYSLGAVRAEALARHNPRRYRQLVLIGGPTTPAAHRLRAIERAVVIAGERDRQAPMKTGGRKLQQQGVPTVFLELPEAAHGEMGPDSERVMSQAFEFLQSAPGARGGA